MIIVHDFAQQASKHDGGSQLYCLKKKEMVDDST